VPSLSEADGTGGSKIRAMGAIYKAKAKAADKAESDYQILFAEVNPKLNEQLTKLEAIETQRKTELEALNRAALTGFASRLKSYLILNSIIDRLSFVLRINSLYMYKHKLFTIIPHLFIVQPIFLDSTTCISFSSSLLNLLFS